MPPTLEAVEAATRTDPLTVTFSLRAEVEPSVLPRVLEPFALRNLTPLALSSRCDGVTLRIDVTVAGLARREVDHLALKLNNMVPVRTVLAAEVG